MRNKKISKLSRIPSIDKDSIKVNDISEKLKLIKSEKHGDNDDKIKISFEVFSREIDMFNLGSADQEWFISLLDTIKLLTSITKKQLFYEYKDKFKPHHYGGKINYKDDYLLNDQIYDEAYQLRINKSQGRIHGFFVGNTYYIRFLDKNHNMYDSEGCGTITTFSFPMTSFESLSVECEKLRFSLSEEKEKNYYNSELICNCCSECQVIDGRDNKKVVDKFEF